MLRPRIWDLARQRDPAFTCANLFWWYAMYCGADVTVTPRPMYPADGRKLPDVWTQPPTLRASLQQQLGTFPLFNFWGPATSIKATRWITDAAIEVQKQFDPTLNLIYLPHLDYGLQKFGPDTSAIAIDLNEIDAECGRLIDFFHSRGSRVVILSEYGIEPVSTPVHLNRVLREAGLITVRDELGHELLDAGASAAFAVADHQIAHVYVNDRSKLETVRALIANTPGVERVLDATTKKAEHLDHARTGDFVAIAKPGHWFTYYYWLDESHAPDFAHTVDIHRKPGYDPAELFFDPTLPSPKARVVKTLLKRKLGLNAMMDVIGTDATLVKGSHGRAPTLANVGPLLMTDSTGILNSPSIAATDVCDVLLRHVFD